MFAKLREIFIREYIGAILIALFTWQGGVEVVTRISRIVYWRLTSHPSVLAPTSSSPFPWEYTVFSAVSSALYLLTAVALLRWLYGKGIESSPTQPEPGSDNPR